MSDAVHTLEGWYALHDFRSIDWGAWGQLDTDQKQVIIQELMQSVDQWTTMEAEKSGSTAVYRIVGQKADFMFMHLRNSLEQLNELETAFNKSTFAQFTLPEYSYVSVVELSNYVVKPGADPQHVPEIAARLRPILPKTNHVCFYPMNKRRTDQDNWYMLDMEQRRSLMKSHSLIGRKYAGQVRQIITGSVGFDDWEWGVTLFADDALTFKKLVYEMRFDEVSARYGEFGSFFVGNLLDKDQWGTFLA